jgi:hypothetical protein
MKRIPSKLSTIYTTLQKNKGLSYAQQRQIKQELGPIWFKLKGLQDETNAKRTGGHIVQKQR